MTESTITPADPATPQDQLLGQIFTDPQAGEQPLPPAQAISTANTQVVVAIDGLNIPDATAEQAQELSGHGSPDLRPASVAYQALLAKRPELGAGKGITPARFQAVIDKDRAYDTLGTTIGSAQKLTQGAVIRSQAQVCTSVTTVAVYVTPRLDSQKFTDNQNLTIHFTPVAVQMNKIQTKTQARDQRQTLKQVALHTTLTDQTQEQSQVPLIGRLIEGAQKSIDLLAHPDPTPTPAIPTTTTKKPTKPTTKKPTKKKTPTTAKTPGKKTVARGTKGIPVKTKP